MIDSHEIQRVVAEWVDHELAGEPPGLTALRQRYANHHLKRCLRALELVPNPVRRGRLLELGSGLYLMTFLLLRFRNYDLECVQYWSRPNGEYESVLENRKTGHQIVFPFQQFNAEVDVFPYPDSSFDVTVNCDTIEHLLCNPVHMLAEIHRVLKPGGLMLITTPNVLRLSNVIALLRGQNVYDKYCQVSPYARHPREYTPDELCRLLQQVGFRVTHLETRDVTEPTNGPRSRALARLFITITSLASKACARTAGVSGRWRGEQIFLAAESAGTARRTLPDFLFEAPDLAQPLIDSLCRQRQSANTFANGLAGPRASDARTLAP